MNRPAIPLMLAALLIGCSKPASPPVVATSPPPPLTAEAQHAAIQRGKAIAAETFSLLSSNLQSAIQSGGISNALPFCSLAASPLTAGMAGKYGVSLRRVSHQARNPANQADDAELGVLKVFEAALAADSLKPPAPLATNLVAETATFFAPIVLNNTLCLKCHGEPGSEIVPEHLAVIRRLYPHDAATGFKLGQLRGAWRIDFPLGTLTAVRQPVTP